MAYYGFKKYSHQQTRTVCVGDTVYGVTLKTNSTTATDKDQLLPDSSGSVALYKAGTLVTLNTTSSANQLNAVSTLSGVIVPGKDFLLAEDYSSDKEKIVLFELSCDDIDNLITRPEPRKIFDLNGKVVDEI